MCLILTAHRLDDEFPLIVVANRDEFFKRNTARISIWDDPSDIIAGKDLEAGGTWMGISSKGRFAAVTNFREPGVSLPSARSRGRLPVEYLHSSIAPQEWLEQQRGTGDQYNGFNFLGYDGSELRYWSNRDSTSPALVPPGVHGVSNSILDTPWPKVERGKAALKDWVSSGNRDAISLMDLLTDNSRALDGDLPNTGVGLERERNLSPMFIRIPDYGTRCTTAVLFHRSGLIRILERSFNEDSSIADTTEFELITT